MELEEAGVRRGGRRQRFSLEQKRQMVEATLMPGASVARVAREHGVNANQVFAWRKAYKEGLLEERRGSGVKLLPVRVAGSDAIDIESAHQSAIAAEAIRRIAELYAIESEVRGKPPDMRQKIRQSRARSLLDDLRSWFEKILATLSRKSETAIAIRYALSRWRALSRYLDDGTIEIDNNSAERALRAVCLGRKNFLFAGSDDGGERAAAIYTLTGSARLNGLDPELYLRHVLERIADHPITRIRELLPWNLTGLRVHTTATHS